MPDTIREEIYRLIKSIKPFDSLERRHISEVLSWINSGVEIYRIKKDAIPPKHLVSYALIVDTSTEKVLLFDHKNAQLKLPSGGHIDLNELPVEAAKRELTEELNLSLPIYQEKSETVSVPYFISIAETVGINEPHTDVSLWYIFEGDSTRALDTETGEYQKEFDNFFWMSFEKVLSIPIKQLDPHMHRVIKKIQEDISDPSSK